MFINDQLIYVQMQKTGCTHIASILSDYMGGIQDGKHNSPSRELISEKERVLISSIRNPWDWYLSLWTYGCSKRGGLFKHLTTRSLLNPLRDRDLCKLHTKYLNEYWKNSGYWACLYSDASSIENFRTWLNSILSDDFNSYVSEGYGTSEFRHRYGFMTYRFLVLNCFDSKTWLAQTNVNDFLYNDVTKFYKENCFIDSYIRQEWLVDELEDMLLNRFGMSVCRDMEEAIRGKTNQSKRVYSVTEYYDESLMNLVGRKDKLIVDLFNYDRPKG